MPAVKRSPDVVLPGPGITLSLIRAIWGRVEVNTPKHPASRVLALEPYDPALPRLVRALARHNVKRLAEIRARLRRGKGDPDALLLEDAGLRLALFYGWFASTLHEGHLFKTAGIKDNGRFNERNFQRIGLHFPGEPI